MIASTLQMHVWAANIKDLHGPEARLIKPPQLYAQSIRQIKVYAGEINLSTDWSKLFPSLQLLVQGDAATFSDVEDWTASTKKEIRRQETFDRDRRDALAHFEGKRSFRYQLDLSFGEFYPGVWYSSQILREVIGEPKVRGEIPLFVRPENLPLRCD